jgi:hypothetical protein
MKTTKIMQMTIRIVGTIQLIMGILVWIGKTNFIIPIHILLGLTLTFALFALTYQAYRAGVKRWLVVLAAVLAQGKIFPGSLAWLAKILHLLCGLGAVGLAEMMGIQMGKKSS